MATWGERLVPLSEFRQAVQRQGRELDPDGRRAASADFVAHRPDSTPVEGPFSRIAVFMVLGAARILR